MAPLRAGGEPLAVDRFAVLLIVAQAGAARQQGRELAMSRRAVLLIVALVGAALPQGRALALEGRLASQGAALVLTLDDGRALRGHDLVGLRLVLGVGPSEIEARIDGFEEDRTIVSAPLALYRITVPDPGGQESRPLCEPDAKGRAAAFALPGRDGSFKVTCTSGAEGKCVLFGYRPWQERDGTPMADLHRACIHMLRADYGGDNRPATRNGTRINVFDRFGIQHPDPAPGMAFEAGWSPDGAVCVAHPRIADLVDLDDLARQVPRLAGRLGREHCTEAAMRADPRALIFNQSVDATR
jgi:ADYC domain